MEKCLQRFLEEHEELEKVFWEYFKDEVWNCAESYGFDPDDEEFQERWGFYTEPDEWYDDHAHNTGYGAAYGTAEGLLLYIKDEYEEECDYDPHDEDNQVLVCQFFGVSTSWE